jgi:NAD(P)-dependent dehydrogenase (short-subunit alcohol dehydrogenase family)
MSRYAAAYADPKGPGDARPTALDVIRDEGAIGKLAGKVVVITGTSSGIGIEIARAMAATEATLFLTARNLTKAREALGDLLNSDRVTLVEMELESFDSVRAAAKTILSRTDKVNILINNAGMMAVPTLQHTREGHELHFGTNHLGHFLFFKLLKRALLAATTPELQSRVVSVASSAHRSSGLNETDNYAYQKGGYDAQLAYGQSKTANIYMANEIERRYGNQGLHATSLHPGGSITGLTRHMPDGVVESLVSQFGLENTLQSHAQAAATMAWAAVGREWENKGGKYLVNCEVTPPVAVDAAHFDDVGYAEHAYNPAEEARLWTDSLKMVGMEDD